MIDSSRSEKLSSMGAITAIVLGLYLSSLHSYILFHGLIEIITIAIAVTLFILAWNTREYLANNYLKVLGIGYAFIALIDLLHTLAYKGMNVFAGHGANLPTQLWIAARYLQAVTLLAAPLFMERRMDNRAVVGVYAAVVSMLLATVFSGYFPDCFIEGKGLTAFKINSEYVITALLLSSIYLLYRKRNHFNDRVFLLTVSSVACTAFSEISFTAYVSVYGFANLAGHFAKLAAFYLIYQAILVTGLKEPFALIFRELEQARENLEEQVNNRTAELKIANEQLKEEIAVRQQAEKTLHHLNRELRAISDCNQTMMRAEDEQTLLNDICRIVCDEAGYRMAWVGFAEHDDAKTVRPVAWGGVEDRYLSTAAITWADRSRGNGPTGIAIRTGKTDCIRDFAEDQKAAPWRDSAVRRGYRSSIALPLKDERENTFGALALYSTEPNAFTTGEIRLLEELAGDLAFGITVLRGRIERKRAEEEVRLNLVQQKVLLDVYQKMPAAQIREVIAFVADKCANLTGSVIGFVGLISDDDKHMEAHVWSETVMENCPLDKPLNFPLDEAGLWAEPIRQRKTIIVNDYSEPNPLKKGCPSGHLKLLRFMGIPVLDNDRVVAVAGVANKRENYSETDQYKVFLLLKGMWDIIKRRRAEEELRRLNDELESRVKQRTAELEKRNYELEQMNKAFVGRELRMVELKERVKELERIVRKDA